MFSHYTKRGAFVLEGLNAFSTTIYFNYIFFHMRDQFGFTNLGNLSLCAISGAVYCVTVWLAGKFAQRRGYFVALRLGFLVMGLAMFVGSGCLGHAVETLTSQIILLIVWTLGMSFTWPALEAITSEGEPPVRLQKVIGIYNVVWSTAGAASYFIGGALYERLGTSSIFLVPGAIHLVEFLILVALERESKTSINNQPNDNAAHSAQSPNKQTNPPSSLAKVFLQMAWIANPFAYIAMNALIPVIPRLAERFGLGPMIAGFFCSTWLFARSASFAVLWLWPGWHYRFRWLIGSYLAMSVCFLAILLGKSLLLLFLAQLVFGFAVGLIYYSSLYYSMDVGETKGEHGGFHEAAIGAGIFAGPAVGALSLRFFPSQPNLNAWAVAVLLIGGAAWILALRPRMNPTRPPNGKRDA